MTHPTIEAMEDAYYAARETDRPMISAARVILVAEPSEAEIEAFAVCAYGPGWDGRWHPHAVKAEKLKIRDCLKAANAARAKETGL